MTRRLSLPLLTLSLCVGLVPCARAQEPFKTPLGDYVEIDGKKNPELLPEWLVWQHAFRIISSSRQGGLGGLTRDFDESFSPDELALLYKEADAQQERDRGYQQRMERTHQELIAKGADATVVAKVLFDVELQSRQRILDARDRVFAGVSPESQSALARYAEETRTNLRSLVPRSELEQFRLPQ